MDFAVPVAIIFKAVAMSFSVTVIPSSANCVFVNSVNCALLRGCSY